VGQIASVKDGEKLGWLNEPLCTTLLVDGNHENFNSLSVLLEWHGGKVHEGWPNILHLMRGQVFTLDGCTFFTILLNAENKKSLSCTIISVTL
jgi:hypothetical protein